MISQKYIRGSTKKHNCGINDQLWYWFHVNPDSLLLPSYICIWMFCFCFYTVSKALSVCISFNLACHVIDTKYLRNKWKTASYTYNGFYFKDKLIYRWKQMYCLGMKISGFVSHFWNYVLFGKSLSFWVSFLICKMEILSSLRVIGRIEWNHLRKNVLNCKFPYKCKVRIIVFCYTTNCKSIYLIAYWKRAVQWFFYCFHTASVLETLSLFKSRSASHY